MCVCVCVCVWVYTIQDTCSVNPKWTEPSGSMNLYRDLSTSLATGMNELVVTSTTLNTLVNKSLALVLFT